MDLEEYLRTYGATLDTNPRNYLKGLVQSAYGVQEAGGLLQFTEETACCWGGPWPGGFAAYRLTDHRETIYILSRKGRRLTAIGDDCQARHPKHKQEMVTTAKPFELKLYGNDDTSYTKFYATLAEAQAELALFEGNQPLDFHGVIEDFGFTFTN